MPELHYPIADGPGDIHTLTVVFDRNITDTMPPELRTSGRWDERAFRAWWLRQATELEEELYTHLPGALYDALLAKMLQRRASLLHVSHE